MKKEQPKPARKVRSPALILVVLLLVLGGAVGGIMFWQQHSSRIEIEKSAVSAPVMRLSLVNPGIIERVYVKEGDLVKKNQIVATVGNTSVYAKADGLVIGVKNEPGSITSSTDPVVSMIDPHELRIVGRIEEDKGLADLQAGQAVRFTVDAFGDRDFYGTVERTSPSSREGDIVFSISDKREEKEFNVIVRYDLNAYPELKNGMSARIWVYK